MTDLIWNIVGISAAALTSISFIPQLVKGYRTRKMDDVSAEMLGLLMLGLFLWLLYGIHIDDYIVIGSNVFGIMTLALTLALKLKYSRS
jgi:MtN3 and saliva related transmembrane protein